MNPYSPAQARDDVTLQWTRRMTNKGRMPAPLDWDTSTAADGSPLVSARIDSPFANSSLLIFVQVGTLVLDESGPCQQPQFDYSIPGRTACLWRTGGVWVELWHPESALAVPAQPAAPALASVRKPRLPRFSPSARLPLRRKQRAAARTTKEN
ncbi:hypothetical protein [Streptomyces sp. Wb2n-11]|uniref:hypothetical protein n=1 Tax=Streptomyces sp. Wb2n-11 TaxID=1030533 RepID=UPI000B0AC09E|nr:hypothetical protein [Streptomyces sp. Wb2n-11]